VSTVNRRLLKIVCGL